MVCQDLAQDYIDFRDESSQDVENSGRVVSHQNASKMPMILQGYVRPGFKCQRLVIVKTSG
jgi:hypothetical protein